jgi:RsiW-degrading membrane proteinase PrsW (M82 family)
MGVALLALAIAPGLALAFFIYSKDREKEPANMLIKAFLWGMVSVIPAIILETQWQSFGYDKTANIGDTAFYAIIVVALSEEAAKFFFLRKFFYRHNEFDEPFDGIVYAVFIALGFATLENVFYAFQYGMSTTIWRMFTAVPAHAADGVIMGYFVGMAKFKKENRTMYLILGLAVATLFHGAYDFSLMQSNLPDFKLPGALLTLAVAINLSFKAIRIHRGKTPFDTE